MIGRVFASQRKCGSYRDRQGIRDMGKSKGTLKSAVIQEGHTAEEYIDGPTTQSRSHLTAQETVTKEEECPIQMS